MNFKKIILFAIAVCTCFYITACTQKDEDNLTTYSSSTNSSISKVDEQKTTVEKQLLWKKQLK